MNIVFVRENSSRHYPTTVHIICGSTVELRLERMSVNVRGRLQKTIVLTKKSNDVASIAKMLQLVQEYVLKLQNKGYIFKTIRLS
jgi:hypothetical protein